MIYTNRNITDESILIFEYFTSSGEKDKSIILEAESLIFSLVDDLKVNDLYLLIHESYKDFFKNNNDLNLIFINESLESWILTNSHLFSKAIFIAGENNNNLFKFTKILEDNNVKLYVSTSKAVEICSNKFKTYQHLYNIVPQPRTYKITIDNENHWRNELKNIYKQWSLDYPSINLKLILKPNKGVDSDDVFILNDLNDLNQAVFPINSEILVQKYIGGEDISVSLISDGNKAIPISLNKQLIEITDNEVSYLGGESPYESKFKYEAFYIATRAVESIEGLKGFIGVDLRINHDSDDINDVYLIEINSRFASPYIGLKRIANFNIGQTIIAILDSKINIEEINYSLNGKITYKKENGILKIGGINL